MNKEEILAYIVGLALIFVQVYVWFSTFCIPVKGGIGCYRPLIFTIPLFLFAGLLSIGIGVHKHIKG